MRPLHRQTFYQTVNDGLISFIAPASPRMHSKWFSLKLMYHGAGAVVRHLRRGTSIAPVWCIRGWVMGEPDSRRCARCGHAPLILLLFVEGGIQSARFGCACFSVFLNRCEAEQVLQEQQKPTRYYMKHLESQPAI